MSTTVDSLASPGTAGAAAGALEPVAGAAAGAPAAAWLLAGAALATGPAPASIAPRERVRAKRMGEGLKGIEVSIFGLSRKRSWMHIRNYYADPPPIKGRRAPGPLAGRPQPIGHRLRASPGLGK